jgi:cytochrome P450
MLRRIPHLRQDPLRVFRDLAKDYGGLLRVDVPRLSFHLATRPDYVKHVLQDNQRNYIKGSSVAPARILVGEGLATSDGDLWRRQRRLMQPAFHRKRLATLADLMTDSGAKRLERWQELRSSGEPFDLAREMMQLTLEVIVRTMFSHDIRAQGDVLGNSFALALRFIDDRSFGSLAAPLWLPTPGNRRFKRALAQLDGIVNGVVSDRSSSNVDYEDLLDMLMAARDMESGEGMSSKQLRDEIVTIFFAGHETTALTLTWAWTLLFENPEWRERIEAEVEGVLGDRRPKATDVPALKATRMVLDETLRLFPPAWIFARSAVEDDVIGGYRIPANANVFLSPYLTHRDPQEWEAPDEFRPERFDPDLPSDRKSLAYYPFGAGPRLCIGRDFALMEATLLLAMMVQSVDLAPASEEAVRPVPLVTLRPSGPVWVTAN